MIMYKPKHQKLILRCYPSKKLPGNETKPNNAELSYLIYYAKTRRTKLEKVCTFLDKKTNSDAAHGRVGHLKVTLYILQELIKECTDNLGILTPTIIHTIFSILKLRDLNSSQLASDVFERYCQALNPQQRQIFTQDGSNLKMFLKLTFQMIHLDDEYTSEDWQKIAIKATHAASCYVDAVYTSQLSLIEDSINMLLVKLEHNASSPELVKTVTNSDKQLDESSLTIRDRAMLALKLFFDTNNKKQVDLSTKSLVSYILKHHSDPVWTNMLIEACTKKTHIELRYRIISILILELNKANDYSTKSSLATFISNLLSCEDVNMVGLPVKEILGDILQLEKHLIIKESVSQDLEDEYNNVIRSLSKHIYYNNQINDMVEEILGYYYQLIVVEKTKFSTNQLYRLSNLFIYNLEAIFQATREDELINAKKAPYISNIFDYLYFTIDFKGYPEYEVEEETQTKWFRLVEQFLKYDCKPEIYSKPNYENLISEKMESNPIAIQLDTVEEICNFESKKLNGQVLATLKEMIKDFGLNFIITFLRFTKRWLQDPNDFKYSLTMTLLYEIGEFLGNKELSSMSIKQIGTLVHNNQWYDEFDVPASQRLKSSGDSSLSSISQETIISTLSTNLEVGKWLEYAEFQDRDDNPDELELRPISREPPKFTFSRATTTTNSILNNEAGVLSQLGIPGSTANGGNVFSASTLLLSPNLTGALSRTSSIANFSLVQPSMSGALTGMSAKSIISSSSTVRNINGTATGHTADAPSAKDLRGIIANGSAATSPNTSMAISNSNINNNFSPIKSRRSTKNSSDYKKSGLAYCITDLGLTDDEDGFEIASIDNQFKNSYHEFVDAPIATASEVALASPPEPTNNGVFASRY